MVFWPSMWGGLVLYVCCGWGAFVISPANPRAMAFMKNKKQSKKKMFDKEKKEKHDKWIIEDKERTIIARSTGEDNNCQ
jgi:hypothetical protein